MKNSIISRVAGIALLTGAVLSLNSCQRINVVDDLKGGSVEEIIARGNAVTLDIDFVSDFALGTIDLFAFDDNDSYVGSWSLHNAAPLSIRLNRGSYKFMAWGNVGGTFLPSKPLVGVTKISEMKISDQSIEHVAEPNHILVGITKGVNFGMNQAIQIPLIEFRQMITFDVSISNWDVITNVIEL